MGALVSLMKQATPQLPTFGALMLPTLQALQTLGGTDEQERVILQVASEQWTATNSRAGFRRTS